MSLHVIENNEDIVMVNGQSMEIFVIDAQSAEILQKRRSLVELSITEQAYLREIEQAIGWKAATPQATTQEQRISAYRTQLNRLTLVLTSTCTLRCKYCYEGDELPGSAIPKSTRLDSAVAIRAIDEIMLQYGHVRSVMLFGGEPTTEPALMQQIIDHFKAKNRSKDAARQTALSIITNGTRYDSAIAGMFRDAPLYVTVSVDGPQAVHDSMRVRPDGSGSWEAVWRNTLAMKADGISMGIQCTVTPQHLVNRCGIAQLAEFFTAHGFANAHIVPAQFAPGMAGAWEETTIQALVDSYLTAAEDNLRAIESGSIANAAPFSLFVSILRAFIKKQFNSMICPAGGELAVSPEGEYFPCFMLMGANKQFRIGQVGSVNQDFWQSLDGFLLSNQKHANPECGACWAAGLCHGCAGANFNTTGDSRRPEGISCRITKGLAEFIALRLAQIQSSPERWRTFLAGYKQLVSGQPQDNC